MTPRCIFTNYKLKRRHKVKNILSKETERRQKLLFIFMEEIDWISSANLVTKLNCNIKTLRSDIEYFQETFDDIIKIEYSKKLGYRMFEHKNKTIMDIFLLWIQDSSFFAILSDVFYERNASIDYFYDTYFISEATLKRIIFFINSIINPMGMSLSYKNPQITAKDEVVLRLFYLHIGMEQRSIYNSWLSIEQEKVFQLLDICTQWFGIKIPILQKNALAYYVFVSIVRAKQSHFLSIEKDIPKDFYHALEENLSSITFLDNQTLNAETEQEKIADVILSMYHLMETLQKSYANELSYQTAKELTSYIVKDMNLQIDKQSVLGIAQSIAYFDMLHQLYPFATYFINHRSYFSVLPIKKEFLPFYQSYMEAIHKINKKVPWLANYSDEILNSTFIRWDNLQQMMIKQRGAIKIFISTTLGKDHIKLLTFFLEHNFNPLINIIGFEYAKTNYKQKRPYYLINSADLIITNYDSEFNTDNLIIINDIPTSRNLDTIRREIMQFRKLKAVVNN